MARGHLKTLDKLNTKLGLVIYNFDIGQGYSVLDMIKAFEHLSDKAANELDWKVTHTLKDTDVGSLIILMDIRQSRTI